MSTPAIDTGSLLTMLGIVAAVWAVVPATARLTFRLSFSWLDALLVLVGVLAIHVLVFEQILRSIGLYPNIGDWRWGFDKSGALYFLFLALVIYIYLRARATRLNRRNLPIFETLAFSLLHARKFDELGGLLETHLETILKLALGQRGWRDELARRIAPTQQLPSLTWENKTIVSHAPPAPAKLVRITSQLRTYVARHLRPAKESTERARLTVKTLLGSRVLVRHLALAHPYLCVKVMDDAGRLAEEFQDQFFEAILADENSVFYSELKNNYNLRGGHRLCIPSENRLLSHYFFDVKVAAKSGVYRSLGEAMLATLSFDSQLVERLNGPLITYADVERYRSPISSGIHFFRIMVLEGLHQRVHDHLWLHYVTHFVDRILERARACRSADELEEFATPFCYLLYELVSVTTDWIEESIPLTTSGHTVTQGEDGPLHLHIAFEAARALGVLTMSILRSTKITERLKDELFGMVIGTYKDIAQCVELSAVARAMESAMLRPYGFTARDGYVTELANRYARVDHVLRADTRTFKAAVDAELSALQS